MGCIRAPGMRHIDKIAAKCLENSAEGSDYTSFRNVRGEHIYILESYKDYRCPSVPCECEIGTTKACDDLNSPKV